MPTLILDGDINVYAAASAVEKAACIDPGLGLWTWHVSMPDAIKHLNKQITDLKERYKTDKVIAALSDPGNNWRKDVLPDYKSNRQKIKKPIAVRELRKYLKDNYEVMQRPNLEGDDVMGILATSDTLIDGDRIIVSIDKDMRTIPCTVASHKRVGKKTVINVDTISEDEANYNHMFQTLKGDVVDGYTGCPGIGKVGAEKVLKGKEGTVWERVVNAFLSAGETEEYALAQARVARICRASDYDFAKGEVILWNPPNNGTTT